MNDFGNFADDVLLSASDLQKQFDQRSIDLTLAIKNVSYDVPKDWRMTVAEFLEKRGFASTRDSDLGVIRLRVTGAGFIRAEEIRRARLPKSLREKIREVSRSDWIAFGAFLISLVALFK